jgi:hypothetical protein
MKTWSRAQRSTALILIASAFVAVLALLAAMLGLALNLPKAFAQDAAAEPTEITIEGKVAEVFGSRFIMETDRGRILLDPGDKVSATGSLAQRTLLARRVAGADGSVLHDYAGMIRARIVGHGDIMAALAARQLTPIGLPVRKTRHTEVMARMANGRTVFVSFDRFGRIDEIEDAAHDREAVVASRALSRSDYLDIARRAGFDPLDELEVRLHHVRLLSRNHASELVELHIDRAGYIYRQVWVR